MTPRLALFLLPAALASMGCKGGAPGQATPAASAASSAPAGSTAAASASSMPGSHLAAPTREGGAISRAPGDDALYVADEDHGVVRRIPLPFDPVAPVITVAMPGVPAQVLTLGDRVLVTVRSEGGTAPTTPAAPSPAASPPPSRIPASSTGPGLLLIMRPDAAAGLVEVARVALPADAWGLAVTPDEKTALVSSAWTHQVSAIDLATAKKTWSIDVPREPRAIVVRPDGTSAYVTHLVGGRITRLDGLGGQPTAQPISLPPSPLRSPSGKTLDGTLAYAGVLSPDGSRFFVARHALGALGEAAWFGAATVDVLVTADDTPLAPKREGGLPVSEAPITRAMRANSIDSPGQFPRVAKAPFAEPRAMVYRRSTSTLLVASEGTNRLVELDARAVDPTMFVKQTIAVVEDRDTLIPVARTGGAPSGLALSADESTVWVFCRTTDDVVEVHFGADAETPATRTRLHLADDPLGEPDGKGRRMFYDATDPTTSGGVACAGCHPEGRDDGHVWHEFKVVAKQAGEGVNFLGDEDQAPIADTSRVGYPRQTPMLAGRVASGGPYGWHAESPTLQGRLEAGFHLHRWGNLYLQISEAELVGRAQYLTPFLRHGLVPPPRDVHAVTPEEARGKEIFTSGAARCARCHVPDTEYTDRTAYPFSPRLAPPAGFEDERAQEFKTPSLLFVAGTAPYFHDGRASSLEALVEQNGDRMGHTSQLSRDDRAALVAFLRTL